MNPRPIRILLVEDNPGDACLMQDTLNVDPSVQIDVTLVESLSQALLTLGTDRFDAVLTDLTLPDSQGVETFLEIHRQAPEIPIVVVTGLDDESWARRALEQGAQDYLVKGRLVGQALARTIWSAIGRTHP